MIYFCKKYSAMSSSDKLHWRLQEDKQDYNCASRPTNSLLSIQFVPYLSISASSLLRMNFLSSSAWHMYSLDIDWIKHPCFFFSSRQSYQHPHTCTHIRGAFINKLQSVNIFLDIYFSVMTLRQKFIVRLRYLIWYLINFLLRHKENEICHLKDR
jgi:hypothetical protein